MTTKEDISGSFAPTSWLNNLNDYDITVVSKDGCKYCDKSIKVLEKNNVKYQKINISEYMNDEDFDDKYDDLITQSGAKSFPIIYQRDRYIGGYNELKKVEI